MKTMKKNATGGCILTIDLGNCKSVACNYPTAMRTTPRDTDRLSDFRDVI